MAVDMKSIQFNADEVQATLERGELVAMPTDTIFGVVALAKNESAVLRLRTIKKRDNTKAFIVLCANVKQIEQFGVAPDTIEEVAHYWDEPTSIILQVSHSYDYLQGSLEGLAFRVVKHGALHDLLVETGPLAAPSANPYGLPPAESAEQAIEYFGNDVALYVKGSVNSSRPSRLIRVSPSGEVTILRD